MNDELNIISSEYENRKIPSIEQYFDEMDLNDEQKAERKEFAYEFEKIMLFILALILIQKDRQVIDRDYIISQFDIRIRDLIGIDIIDDYIDNAIKDITTDIVDTTLLNIENEDDLGIEIENENWWVSKDRALFIAEDNSNTFNNYLDYEKAVQNGLINKVWIDKKDNRERKTHIAVNKAKMPIKSIYQVGDSLMRFPKDMMYYPSAKEIVNCRCTIKYS